MKKAILLHAVIIFLFCTACGNRDYDVVIKNGKIIDGTGSPYYYADIGIAGGKIKKIGTIEAVKGERIIKADNLIVSPGFIDVHTHCDRGILDDPIVHNYIKQGVTTVVGGNCGGSPLDFEHFFAEIKRKGVSLNIGVLIGHNTIREEVMGSEDRVPSVEELQEMKELIDRAMKAGALGLSTGLKYTPGAYADTGEVIELAKVAARHGGFYATHLREEGLGVVEAVKEAITIGERAKIPVLLSHHKIMSIDKWGESVHTLELIDDARRRGIDVKADQYPYPATSTGLTVLFPTWSLEGGREKLLEKLKDNSQREAIKEYITYSIVHDRGGPDLDNISIASCPFDSTMEGLTIKEILERKKQPATIENAAILIMEMIKEGNVSAIYTCLSDEDIERIMRHPAVMHASDGSVVQIGEGSPHPRNFGTFPRVLARYVRDKHVLTLEEAVRKMTSLPASMIGAETRGILKKGLWADIVIFDPETIRDKATFHNPHQYPEGIFYVIVNGIPVIKEGEITEDLPGNVLYGPGRN